MRPNRSAAPWRAALLTAGVLGATVPIAEAADPADEARRPYVVVVSNGAKGQAVAKEHSRRFGVSADRIFDRVGGYRASMTPAQAKSLARQPGVVVAEDTKMHTVGDAAGSPQNLSLRPYSGLPTGWGWNLDRIDQRKSLAQEPVKNTYHYAETASGVTAYVIDSGVKTDHVEFAGRARVGADFVGDGRNGLDCDGHGTHVAGTIGGATFGVAKQVNIVSVRVLDCDGSGWTSDVVEGIDWVTANAVKPAVANMSLGGSANNALDQAVRNSIDAGVTYTIAAGNSRRDACRVSPARVKEAITIAATDSSDRRASWSNYGSCVDIYAPGHNIVSAYGATGSSNSAWRRLSGTSMSAPSVAGVAALLLDRVSASPDLVAKAIAGLGTTGVVTGSNTSAARLLFSPWQDTDLDSASCLLGVASACAAPTPTPTPAPTPTPTPTTTRPCWLLCFPRT